MRANTCSASASCGTHFGETNDDTSISSYPAADSASTNATFTSVGTCAFSFWSPSRGPTSTMRMRSAGMRER
jgi:hypothetical protein